jgi:cytochrome c
VNRIDAALISTALLLWAAAGAAGPVDGAELVVAKRCNACHELDRVLLGPSWRAIAARHKANSSVMIDVLAQKIIEGGGGNWGVVPMVPNEHVAPDEARTIVRWILDLD